MTADPLPSQNAIDIRVFQNPSAAPNYNRDSIDTRSLVIKGFDIVEKGTNAGRCTVDIVLTAEDGSQFVAMTTGFILRLVASMIQSIDGPN